MKNIQLTNTTFNKVGTKWVQVETETFNIDRDYYNNVINSKHFFNNLGGVERHYKAYTSEGYIVTRVNSISPSKETKVVRHFKFL